MGNYLYQTSCIFTPIFSYIKIFVFYAKKFFYIIFSIPCFLQIAFGFFNPESYLSVFSKFIRVDPDSVERRKVSPYKFWENFFTNGKVYI